VGPNEWDAVAAYRAAARARKLLTTFDREHTQVDRERAIVGIRHEVDTVLAVLVGAVDEHGGAPPPVRAEVTQAVLFDTL
jgi:hypothetical protein